MLNRAMRVGIDISSLMYDRGVSRYTQNLVHSLVSANQLDLTLFGSSWRQNALLKTKADRLIKSGVFKKHLVTVQQWPPKLLSILWRIGWNKMAALKPKIDVFHSWDWLQPPDEKLPLVSTIHDLAILKYPNTAHRSILEAHQRSWQVLREREAQIIAVSQTTKKDIVELLGIPPYRITVIPEALPLDFRHSAEQITEESVSVILKQFSIDWPYLFFVGTREPRKNLERLIEAWKPLASHVGLVIAGAKGWDRTSQTGFFKHPHLKFLGQVTDTELNILYGEAEAFVYPSLYEGFGLPILEAFYHGTPVVTSNVSALVEVAGNAAKLVDPFSTESVRQGMVDILNESLVEQQKRLQRMVIRLQLFSWDKVARETILVYKKALEEAKRT